MTLDSDIQSVDLAGLIEFFQSELEGYSQHSARAYRKAVDSFRVIVYNAESELSERLLGDWYASMRYQGVADKTARQYVDIISGLYTAAVKAQKAPKTDIFRIFKEKLKSSTSDNVAELRKEDFDRFSALLKRADSLQGADSLAVDLILASFMLGATSLQEVAELKTADISDLGQPWSAIVARQADARRRYLFALDQSALTPRQLERETQKRIERFMLRNNIAKTGTIADTLAGYWGWAAMRCGARASEIVSALGCYPSAIPYLELCQVDQSSAQEISSLRQEVAKTFMADGPRWYAMKLRPRIKIDNLKARFAAVAADVKIPEIFYPCEEILRRTTNKGRKPTPILKPVLPDIVFFKSTIGTIAPLFAKIGDLAWCYTTGGRPGSGTYAALSQQEFSDFQRAIAQFTPDYEVGPTGTLELRPGDHIEVIGGDFRGLNGQILDTTPAQRGTIYRIRLFGLLQDIEWRLTDPRLIEKQ